MTGLHKWFGGVRALCNARMVLEKPGVVHALMGQNGSGKSTMLNILSGQLKPDEGDHRPRRSAGHVPQPTGRPRPWDLHGVPGDRPRRGSLGGRERPARAQVGPRAVRNRLGCHPGTCASRARAGRRRLRSELHRARPAAGSEADDRDRSGAVDQRQDPRAGRAHQLAQRGGDPEPLRRHPTAQGTGRQRHLRVAPVAGGLRDRRRDDRAAGWRHRRRGPEGAVHSPIAGRGHGRRREGSG